MLEGFRLEGYALYTPVLMYLRESKSALRSSGTVVQREDQGVKVCRKLLTVGRQGLISRGQLYGLWYCQGFDDFRGLRGFEVEDRGESLAGLLGRAETSDETVKQFNS